MKRMNKYLFALAASVFFGCSSMDLSYDESMESSYPSDFKISEYMDLHPQIVSLQIRDYVVKYNSETGLSEEEVLADQAAFQSDMNVLKKIYTCPRYAGYTEDDWNAIMGGSDEIVLSDCKVNKVYEYLNLDAIDSEGKKSVVRVYAPEVTYDTDGKTILSLKGYAEKEKKTEVSYVVSATLSVASQQPTAALDTVAGSCKENKVHKDGTLGADDIKTLSRFNAYGVADDTTWLAAIPLDTVAIGYHYLLYGRDQGWPYRRCSTAELKNPVKSEEYPVKKLYCSDEKGVIREI